MFAFRYIHSRQLNILRQQIIYAITRAIRTHNSVHVPVVLHIIYASDIYDGDGE